MSVEYSTFLIDSENYQAWLSKYDNLDEKYDNDEVDDETYESAQEELQSISIFLESELYTSELHYLVGLNLDELFTKAKNGIEIKKDIPDTSFFGKLLGKVKTIKENVSFESTDLDKLAHHALL